jgi:hypothetical protein
MFTIEFAHSPIYASIDKNCITLMVKFAEFDKEMPFGATPNDDMPYGIELYNRAKSGEFGDIAIYPDPMIATEPQPTTTGSQDL